MNMINPKYYLYRHIRLDKNEPFYIGVGTINPNNYHSKYASSIYKRAYQKTKRGNIWHKIVNKTSYEVEIVLESDDYNFILKKETEFIALYGRINTNIGVLSNLTDGGEYNLRKIITDEHRKKISLGNKGKIRTQQQKDAHSLFMKGRKVSKETKEKLSKAGMGRKLTLSHIEKIKISNRNRCISNETKNKISNSLTGSQQTEETKLKRAKSLQKKVKQSTKNGDIIKIYESVTDVINQNTFYKRESVRKCCQNILKTYKKFLWNYV